MEKYYTTMSKLIVSRLDTKVELSENEREIITYYIRTKISELFSFTVLLILFYCFKSLDSFALAFIVAMLTRSYMGGIHHNSYLGCFLHTALFFAVVLILAEIVELRPSYLLFVPFSVIDIAFAPCVSDKRGKYGTKARKRMKLQSLLGLLMCGMLCQLLATYKSIILITLVMVHIELIIAIIRERMC